MSDIETIVRRMDQGKRPKKMLSVRVGEDGLKHIQDRAARADVDVSHMARRMFAYAAQNMPEGWVPSRPS